MENPLGKTPPVKSFKRKAERVARFGNDGRAMNYSIILDHTLALFFRPFLIVLKDALDWSEWDACVTIQVGRHAPIQNNCPADRSVVTNAIPSSSFNITSCPSPSSPIYLSFNIAFRQHDTEMTPSLHNLGRFRVPQSKGEKHQNGEKKSTTRDRHRNRNTGAKRGPKRTRDQLAADCKFPSV